jgi:hypothetical protein
MATGARRRSEQKTDARQAPAKAAYRAPTLAKGPMLTAITSNVSGFGDSDG